ncbi:MAG: aspartate carbamoyltransferase catalytic subunit [Deltaproteobacteria bacterium]|nr:aspartate carbamoyltransferase catalytic subunit [Deltaproteobacteria bacterium]
MKHCGEKLGQHLLGIAGLSKEQIAYYLDTAETFLEVGTRSVKKVPTLRGKTIVNMFLEDSTRTRTSFEIAGKRLSADTVNISSKGSSMNKGETLIDTAVTLQCMQPDAVVMRHASSGSPHLLASYLTDTAIINAGDGLHEHPTQALLDALTVRKALGRLNDLVVTFVGDAYRSRVFRSDKILLETLGSKVRLIAPPTIAKNEFKDLGVEVFFDMESGLKGSDVVVSLRMKHEYLNDCFVPSLSEYSRRFCITENLLAKYCPDCIVLAPGPFVRGTEISSEVIDGNRSFYTDQVAHGVAVRMAVLYLHTIGKEVSYEV